VDCSPPDQPAPTSTISARYWCASGEWRLILDHAVIVYLRLTDDRFGAEAERDAFFALEDLLVDAIDGAGLGEFDGNEFGGGECKLYIYGYDADRMFNAISPILQSTRLARGGHAIKRYGAASDPLAMEIKIPL
jgi:hypothetical protein